MLDSNTLSQVKTLIEDGLTCPADISGLNKVIELKNKLTKQLNNIYDKIDSINKFLDPLESLVNTSKVGIDTAQIAIDALQFIPSTVATPIPAAGIIKGQKAINKLNKLVNKTEGQIGTGVGYLNIVKSNLERILDLLALVDLFIGKCSEDLLKNSTGDQNQSSALLSPQTRISNELLSSTQEQSNQLSPVVTNINGFKMGIVTIDSVTIGGLKRRRAIAKNKAGIVILKGEPSFSSNDQILIDELIFYIKQNDLKAE